MPLLTCTGATLRCTMGAAPGTLLPRPKALSSSQRVAADIMDHVPIVQVTPFGMCRSIANPAVAAATAAASGVLTPMPCIPATPAPWVPGSATVALGGLPALGACATLSCLWAGTISIVDAGQSTVTVA